MSNIIKEKLPELLAPAGSLDSVYAAISGGADAVYFGGRTANARFSAKNFSNEEIAYAINLLHGNNKLAYITLNILHTDRELKDVLKFAEHCYINNADAFIIQDIGLSQIIRKYFPDIKLHASTQAAGHNLYSAQKLSSLGFSRMVISRESDRNNLKYLIDNSPNNFEIEMFVHGALCSSHSGRCFMSFALGNTRSANKGMCAQPCRLKYNNKYMLSLKDLCLAGHIKEIIGLSPASLKIEGRMKPPEYVYNVCKIYRSCLDEKRNATKSEIDFLADIFSREGFTDGYFTKNPGVSMYGVRTEENKIESKKYANINFQLPPSSADDTPLASMRRGQRISQKPHSFTRGESDEVAGGSKNIKINPKLCLIFNSTEQFNQIYDYLKTDEIFKRIYRIFLPPENNINQKIPHEFAKITGIRLPYVIFDDEREQIIGAVKKNCIIDAVKTAGDHTGSPLLVDNIGHVDIAKNINPDFELFGNFGLNVTNSYTLDEYRKMGFNDIILSPELNFAQIRDINKPINCGIIAYGRTHVMISENCLTKNSETQTPVVCGRHPLSKGGRDRNDKEFYLTDKTGARFFVGDDDPGVPSVKTRNIIYNSVPVYLADKKDLYKNLGLFFVCLNFTDENPEQIKKIISDYALNKDNIKPPEKFTRGYK